MPNTIEQATRASLGLTLTAPSSVTSYSFDQNVGGFPVPISIIDGTDIGEALRPATTTNYLFGFGGNDTLYGTTSGGQQSAAVLVGGAGSDYFTFETLTAGGTLSGRVLDFSNTDSDRLDLSATGLAFSDLTITHNGNNSSATVQGSGVNLVFSGLENDILLTSNNVITSSTGGGTGSTGSTGTGNNDTFQGTDAEDVYSGLGGADLIFGNAGRDTLNGNQGNDTVHGGLGTDDVQGGKGNDYVNGNIGNDNVNGNIGDDTVEGGQNDDVVRGGQGNDNVNGNLGNDTVYGDLGDDIVRGGADNDSVSAGDGNDVIYGDKGNDTLVGGEGVDTFYFLTIDHGNDVITDFVSGVDKLAFSSTLFNSAANVVAAFSGSNINDAFGSVALTGVTSLTEADIIIV